MSLCLCILAPRIGEDVLQAQGHTLLTSAPEEDGDEPQRLTWGRTQSGRLRIVIPRTGQSGVGPVSVILSVAHVGNAQPSFSKLVSRKLAFRSVLITICGNVATWFCQNSDSQRLRRSAAKD